MHQQLPSWKSQLGGKAIQFSRSSLSSGGVTQAVTFLYGLLLPEKCPITGTLQKKVEGNWTLLVKYHMSSKAILSRKALKILFRNISSS